MVEIPGVGAPDAVAEAGGGGPAHGAEAARIQELARGAVGPVRVEAEAARKPHHVGDQGGEIADRDLLPGNEEDPTNKAFRVRLNILTLWDSF